MTGFRVLIFASALAGSLLANVAAQGGDDGIAAPVLRANVTVTSELVRVGDLVDNAGSYSQVPVYRAPDLGTTGMLATTQVINALRAHQVIGVQTGDIKQVSVTRLARTLGAKDIEEAIARALDHRGGLGDAANITLTFDREPQDLRLDASFAGALQPTAVRFDAKTGRFDVTLELANDDTPAPMKLRVTGTAIETVEAVVLTRNVERTDTLKASDLAIERRNKAEIGGDAASREAVLGMQLRRSMRAGQALKVADLAKPDLVQRDQAVTVIYQAPGLYLTTRGKALDAGTEGDVVSVLNLQSKRTVTGVVTGRGQITIQAVTAVAARPTSDVTSSITPEEPANAKPVSVGPGTPPQIAAPQVAPSQVAKPE